METENTKENEHRRRQGHGGSLIIILVFLLLVGGALAVWWSGMLTVGGTRSGYQAVFLTNGQVYFGKVARESAQYVTVTDIYYLQQRRQLQEPQPAAADAGELKPAEPEITLVKLGQELHAPKDRMELNRDHILFIEDLQEEGKVVQAIKRYKEGQK